MTQKLTTNDTVRSSTISKVCTRFPLMNAMIGERKINPISKFNICNELTFLY